MIDTSPPWPNGVRCVGAFSFGVDAGSVVHLSHSCAVTQKLHGLTHMRCGPFVAILRLVSPSTPRSPRIDRMPYCDAPIPEVRPLLAAE